ncbi:MAG: hypothetical protein ACR2MZ_00320 [Candidatus Dormibacter sp.]|uniref:hypothetical protein n=1 Tax=Candidatus Dormibacter sp. TaxID=2973982 RepID=UPI000DB70B0D|nr:MAG: hypothetical protein DLM66_01625 [Candidatus Dormibacteraeota bacterium]
MQSELQRAIDAIHVRFGDQSLVRATRLPAAEPWPTGIPAVDRLSGIGGWPRGRIGLLSGRSGSGKLTLGLALLARATREFAQVVVLDPQRSFDPWTFASLGADLRNLTLVRPPNATAAGEAAVSLARAGAGCLLVLDSLPEPALAPLESAAARSGSAVLAVTGEPAPQGLAFASSLSLSLQRTDWIWERGLPVGLRTLLGCRKNKLAAPGGEAELELRYALGARLFQAHAVRETQAEETNVRELPAWRFAAV